MELQLCMFYPWMVGYFDKCTSFLPLKISCILYRIYIYNNNHVGMSISYMHGQCQHTHIHIYRDTETCRQTLRFSVQNIGTQTETDKHGHTHTRTHTRTHTHAQAHTQTQILYYTCTNFEGRCFLG